MKEMLSTVSGFSSDRSKFILLILRAVFMFLAIGIASSLLFFLFDRQQYVVGVVAFVVVVAVAIAVLVTDLMSRNKQITTISSLFFGLLMGFLLASLFWQALQPIVREYMGVQAVASTRPEQMMQLLLTIVTCYISVSILFQTKDDFRFIIPYVEFSKQLKGSKPLVLDTSVIIDGRIADICETGIVDTKLIIPRFVLQELQGIADSSDKIRRNRGRRGLDILKKMQSNTKVEIQMHEGNIAELRDVAKVDERLVVLAKVLSARVVTNDFNLNKIAQIQGVDVINLNELANALRLVALPGETLMVKIVKQGDQIGQGVGFMDDGTMVVVEQGRSALGQEVNITVTSVLQTPAGRMIFGRIEPRPFVSTAVAAGAAPAQPPA